ncbi:MAG: glycosyltransferase family 2 protein [Clostridia bacterium]|nr:glycosyltransferase family 2 protein [Clostridia bacterium]
MKSLPLISVIIPIYNVERYLKRCIDSAIHQTYENIEILLVNDGSTDSSSDICNKYEKEDNRIVAFHKENGGLADARNYGIRRAKGKYVVFIDSDDVVEKDYVEELYRLIDTYKTKMAIGTMTIVNNKNRNNMGKDYVETVFTTTECLLYMLQDKGFTVSANAKIYLKTLFDDIEYPKGRLYEDNGTTYKLILKCDRIAYSCKSIYEYCLRKDSIISQKFTMKKMDYIYLTDIECENIVNKYPDLLEACEGRKAVARLSVLRQMLNSKLLKKEKEEQRQIVKYLKQHYSQLMKNNFISRKTKISLVALKINKKILKLGAKIYEKVK